MPSTVLASDPFVQRHDLGREHPEQPVRHAAILAALEQAGLLSQLGTLSISPASDDLLSLVHTEEYIALVEREVLLGLQQLSTGDTNINADSAIAARAAVGAVVSAVDAVFSGDARNAFCAVRPPGHHASSQTGMGFCLFNNVAIAARRAQRQWGAQRVAIVDWDVHHGNGTQDVFYSDGSVLFFSTHQSPWYPGTGDAAERGQGPGEGLTINCPLPAGSGREAVFGAFEHSLEPALEAFRPDLILISAGFDSRAGDPLGRFLLTDQDFRDLTRKLMDAADRFCGGRIVSVLEGGYNIEGLASASLAHVNALLGK